MKGTTEPYHLSTLSVTESLNQHISLTKKRIDINFSKTISLVIHKREVIRKNSTEFVDIDLIDLKFNNYMQIRNIVHQQNVPTFPNYFATSY